MTSIGGCTFQDCTNLSSVTIGNSVSSIDFYAFYGCSSLTTVTIGKSVATIEYYAFYGCKNLKDVYCLAESVPTDRYAFYNTNIRYANLYVPEVAFDSYSNTTPWCDFRNIYPIEENIPTGTVDIATVPVSVKSRGGVITVEGLDNNTPVTVYTAEGKFLGSAAVVNNTATISTPLKPGNVVIVDLGKKAVKVVVR